MILNPRGGQRSAYAGWGKKPVVEHLEGSRVKVIFHTLPNTEETALKLRSVGEKLQRVTFKITTTGN